ncbi:MAG: 23S rRNA (guanosine(2251)-2'-O)-methyltransferase RlmB [Acidobacteria bacterium]|nr:23S rRNA (guanosine(2251)-2'-O)-methyltransferase RlmB [Acidobacteriota bacterium]
MTHARDDSIVVGIHAVLGAMAGGARTLNRILVEKGKGGPRFREIFDAAKRAGIPIEEVDRDRLDRLAGGSRHQGVAATAAAAAYTPLEEVVGACAPEGRLILLDGVEDPRNLGAVIRTAAAVGARGVIVPEHRAAGLSPGAARAAAGTLPKVPVARCRNAADLANELKEQGFWVAGLDARGDAAWDEVEYPGRMALVIGGEAKGLRPRVRQFCDTVIAIPLAPGVESLNLSVAAAVVLYEALRQDRAGKGS